MLMIVIQGEVEAKYDETLYNLFCEAFCLLPLAHVINDTVFVTHGGLFSKDGVTLNDIRNLLSMPYTENPL